MNPNTPDEVEKQRIVKLLLAAAAEREGLPISRRTADPNPGKYGDPVGLDSNGNPFPEPERQNRDEPKP